MTTEPDSTSVRRPPAVKLAVRLIVLSVLVRFLGPALSGQPDSAVSVGQVLGLLLHGALAWQIWNGQGWARAAYTVVAAIYLLLNVAGLIIVMTTATINQTTLLAIVVGLAQMAVTTATVMLLFRAPSSAWFSARR